MTRQAPVTAPTTPATASPFVPTPTTPLLGAGGTYRGCSAAPESGMGFQRIILYWFEPLSTSEQCAENATAAGMQLIISVQYEDRWPMSTVVARFQQALALYASLHPYAISVGNEQEVPQQANLGVAQSPAGYAAVWQAVEPLIVSQDPSALRVAGEISPWGLNWFEQAVTDGLPGAQAYAAHPYPDSNSPWTANSLAFVQLASEHHVQAWATEGMCGPGAWMVYGCQPRAVLAQDGFALAVEWYAPN